MKNCRSGIKDLNLQNRIVLRNIYVVLIKLYSVIMGFFAVQQYKKLKNTVAVLQFKIFCCLNS